MISCPVAVTTGVKPRLTEEEKTRRKREYDKQYRIKNKEKFKNYRRKRYLKYRKEALARAKDWYQKNRTQAIAISAERQLHDRFGMTLEEYGELLVTQGGVCAVCRQFCTTKRRLSVDHDHKTNRIRGLLCMHCNLAIGHFKEDVSLLQAAINYLNNARTHHDPDPVKPPDHD